MLGTADLREWCFFINHMYDAGSSRNGRKKIWSKRKLKVSWLGILECSNGEMSPDKRVIGMGAWLLIVVRFGACAKTTGSVIRLVHSYDFATHAKKKKTPHKTSH